MRAEWEAAVRTRAAGDRLRGCVVDVVVQALRSPLSVSLNPRVARDDGRPRVLGVFSFRHDAHLVPGLIENIGPMVDGWVAWDDRSTDSPFGDESRRREALLEAA